MADGNILSGTQQAPIGTDKAYHTDGVSDLFHSFAQLLTYIEGAISGITEAQITLADNTTNDVSIDKHGFVPKLSNVATEYFDGTGGYSIPAGGSSLPVVDSTEVVKGSVDATKKLRFEVDGFTTGNTRVITPPDVDISLPGENRANSFTEPQTIKKDDAVTNAVTDILDIQHSSSGAVANSFGAGIRFGLETSTTENRDAAEIAAILTDKNDASRTSALVFNIVSNAGVLTERARLRADNFLEFPHQGGITSSGEVHINSGTLVLKFNGSTGYAFNSGAFFVGGAFDLGISRSAASVLEINNGTPGTIRDIKLRKILDSNDVQILTTQQTAVVDASGGAVVDTECRAQLNSLLAKLRTHGIIAT